MYQTLRDRGKLENQPNVKKKQREMYIYELKGGGTFRRILMLYFCLQIKFGVEVF